jgi:hypothetical protein
MLDALGGNRAGSQSNQQTEGNCPTSNSCRVLEGENTIEAQSHLLVHVIKHTNLFAKSNQNESDVVIARAKFSTAMASKLEIIAF